MVLVLKAGELYETETRELTSVELMQRFVNGVQLGGHGATCSIYKAEELLQFFYALVEDANEQNRLKHHNA
jgi:hypothetical protein